MRRALFAPQFVAGLALLAVLALLAFPALPGLPAPLAVPAHALDAQEPPVPQEFDWSTSAPIPELTPWGQAVDTAYTRMIRSWTTMPEYTNPVVDHLPWDADVVSPLDHFGTAIGQPGYLHKVGEIYGYFEALASSSPRVDFRLLGETEEGRTLALAIVGSEANLARLDEVKAAMNALADPRGTSEEEAERIIRDMPAIYTFYAGLHSPETGPPEMVMEMAYRLAVSDDPMIQDIRDDALVFIVPVAEPDGRDKTVDWHRRYNQDVYENEDRVPGPPYWGRYIFHDNNRDGLQLSARLTQELVGLFLDWKYPVGHDLHESVPYLYVSTGTGPYNATVDPITVTEWQWMSNYEVAQLTAKGMPGVWTHGFYNGWYPGYLLWVTNTRNAVGRFYETFGNSIPNTMEREVEESRNSVKWYRPNPPREKTIWSLRNNTNYMQTGALTAVHLVATNKETILRNYWTKANNSLNKGKSEAPYAYVVPQDQTRRADASYMLNLIRRQGIEVHQASDDAEFGDVAVAEGDYVIRMDQPYRNFVLTLMQKQELPGDAPSPYDDTAWTYPLMFNVDVDAVDDRAVQDLDMDIVDAEILIEGTHERLAGRRADDTWQVVVPNASAHAITARYALGDAPVYVAEDEIALDDERTVGPGAWLVRSSDLTADAAEEFGALHGLEILTVEADDLEDVAMHDMDLPRIAVLHTWSRTQDEGWARYSLDQAGVPYDYVGENELGGADLRAMYDVILFPHQGGRANAKSIFQGVDPKFSPMPFTETVEFPSHGTPDSTEDMTGGMGFDGLQALRDFVEGGGTLIALGSASTIPIEYGFLRDVNTDPAGDIFVPGSILAGTVENARNPLTYGYGETLPLYHQNGPYLNVPDAEKERVAVRYGAEDGLLLSGAGRNEGQLAEQPAVYSAPLGDGYVVVYGFDALHRHQNLGNHALVWNAILNWNDLGVAWDGTDADDAVAQEPAPGHVN